MCCHLFWKISLGLCSIGNAGHRVSFAKVGGLHARQWQRPSVNLFFASFHNAPMWVRQILWCSRNQELSCPFPYFWVCIVQSNTLTPPTISFVVTPCFFLHGKCQGRQSSHLTCPQNQKGQTVCGSISISHACWRMLSPFDTAHTVASLRYEHAREML